MIAMLENETISTIQRTSAGASLQRTALAYLPVPSLCYSAPRLLENIGALKALQQTMPGVDFAYAVKACALRPVLELVATAKMLVEVQSEHEIRRAMRVNIAGDRMIWNGPRKTEHQLRFAVSSGIRVIADNLSEARDLLRVMVRGPKCDYGVRLNVPGMREAFIQESEKLGMSLADMETFLTEAKALNRLPTILHAHALARVASVSDYSLYAATVADLLGHLQFKFGGPFISLDIGGGWDSATRLDRQAVRLADLVGCVRRRTLEDQSLSLQQLVFEPGRYVVEDAAFAMGRIVRRKLLGANHWVVMDLTTNLMVPVPLARFEAAYIPNCYKAIVKTSFCDGTCSPSGVLERDRDYPEIDEGSVVVFTNCGAYSAALVEPFFEPPASVWWCTETSATPIISSDNARLATDMLQGFFVQ